nr:pyridoxal-dependent decarboxylase, exosortase A system-associated [uncultured Sphingosinicella sp.]
MGTIPAGFGAEEGMLTIGGRRVDALVAEAGDTPLFVYDFGLVRQRVDRFRAAFPGVQLHYAVKANPFAPLLGSILNLVDGLDVASAGELRLALLQGAPPETVSFAGPGKRDTELEEAIRAGVTLNCESEGEAERAIAIGQRLAKAPKLAVRVNPDFEIRGSGMRMGGGAKPFGVDAERVPALVRRIVDAGADWRGFHIFAGSQALDAGALIDAQRATLDLAANLSEAVGAAPATLNLGGGFGIPYFHGEQSLDLKFVGDALIDNLNSRAQVLENTVIFIELGRWLVGEAGVYLTRIVDRKVSHGKTFLVTDGGMHHQLAASGNFGQVVRRNYPVAIANRMDEPPTEEASIVGCLCTPLDRLGDDLLVPSAAPGDLIAIFLAGAYGLTASPQIFLAQQPAGELLVGV